MKSADTTAPTVARVSFRRSSKSEGGRDTRGPAYRWRPCGVRNLDRVARMTLDRSPGDRLVRRSSKSEGGSDTRGPAYRWRSCGLRDLSVVARMERSAIRDSYAAHTAPHSASLHAGYAI